MRKIYLIKIMAAFLTVSLVTIGSMTGASASERSSLGHLSAAAGIVEPSFSSAVFQNPAGLTYNDTFRLSAQGGSNQSSLGDPNYLGALLYGKDSYGLAAGIER